MTGLLSRLLPPPGRTFTNPGDTVVFGEWGPRHREYTAARVYGPYERMFRCDQHQVTWRGYPRCWIGGTECTLTALW